MAKVTHPKPEAGTTLPQVGGVVFVDGVANVDLTDKPNLTEFYLQHGYTVEEDPAEFTKDQLQEILSSFGVEAPKRATKAELVELLEQYERRELGDLEGGDKE